MVTAVIPCHNNPVGLASILKQLREQTRPPTEYLIYYSGGTPFDTNILPDNSVLKVVPDTGDYGNPKCARGIKEASSEVVGFFNVDDEYDKTYIEKLLEAFDDDTSIVACDFISHNLGNRVCAVQPRVASITRGCFLFKKKAAENIPYGKGYEADGRFAEEISKKGFKRIPEALYKHR